MCVKTGVQKLPRKAETAKKLESTAANLGWCCNQQMRNQMPANLTRHHRPQSYSIMMRCSKLNTSLNLNFHTFGGSVWMPKWQHVHNFNLYNYLLTELLSYLSVCLSLSLTLKAQASVNRLPVFLSIVCIYKHV